MEKNIIKKGSKEIIMFVILFTLMFAASKMFAQHQVGHTQITFTDPARSNRAIQTEIYYPAAVAGNNVAMVTDTFPVIVFGHGFAMAWDAYTNLWTEFVKRGYIMVFPRTEGNLFSTDHQQFGWDLQFLVTKMQAENNSSSSIFYNKVALATALMGHSMGGGAAFLAADSLCTNGNINIKTLIGLAPAESTTNGVSSIASATNVTVPSLILSGSNDGVTPPIDHATPMYDNLASSCKTFLNVIGGGHCYYANTNFNCDFGESSSSTGISITRAEQQDITYDYVNLWLDYTLKGVCNAFSEFQDSLSTSVRVSYNQTCVLNPVPTIIGNGGSLTSSETGNSYQWFINGNSVASSNSVTIPITTNGDYTVEVFYANGCSETSAPFTVASVGIATHEFNNFNVYPNPTKGILTINGIELNSKKVEVYSLVGQLVLNTIIGNEGKVDLCALNDGVYFIKVNNVTQRIILSK